MIVRPSGVAPAEAPGDRACGSKGGEVLDGAG